MKGTWTDRRLSRLFDNYNTLFWKGRLPRCHLEIGAIGDDVLGRIAFADRVSITVDIALHGSDRMIRSTLLHEMAHLGAGPKCIGHGAAFLEQVESLLRQGAPLQVGLGETQNHPLLDSVPARFKLTRRALEKVYERRRREMAKMLAVGVRMGNRVANEIPIEACIENDFENAALEGAAWKPALLVLGRALGLVDNDGAALPGTDALIQLARRTYLRTRRQMKEEERARAWFDALPAAPTSPIP